MTELPAISHQIWDQKYRFKQFDGTPIDMTMDDTRRRVAKALAACETDSNWEAKFFELMRDGYFSPAGRIISGAGTGRNVTLLNCFVMGTIPDSMNGIFEMLKEAALTMQQGGGIGYDFSTIRPKGAEVKGVAADASGPLSFMDVWDAMCRTVMSAGERRGAMMATMRVDHPDIEAFIEAKKDAAKLRMFNLSVLITDPFMDAVRDDQPWRLHFEDRHGVTLVERFVPARDLWNRIMRNTYDFAEPGVIFIDRINQLNNLGAIEQISATNPCVPYDTPILTDRGYIPIGELVGESVRVWNGIEFSDVTPVKTGDDQPMVLVKLSDGSSLRCTTAHRFVLKDGSRVPAALLDVGDKLVKSTWPVLRDGDDAASLDYYAQGFFSGDGTFQSQGREGQYIYLYGEKRKIAHAWNEYSRHTYQISGGYEGTDTTLEKDYLFFPEGTFRGKDYVPAEATLVARKNWLAGLIDADGCVTADSCIQISSKNRDFLYQVKLMLNTMGVTGSLAPMKDCWRLSISGNHANFLNLSTYRIKTSPVSFAKARFLTVVSVEPAGCEEEVFCFTENLRHMGVFNGMLTGQCGEQPLPPYGACLLGSINVPKFVIGAFTKQARIDGKKLRAAVGIAVRMMDNVIDVSGYPLEQQAQEARNKRRIGLGVTGLADALIMLGLTYGSAGAVEATEAIMRRIDEAAYQQSAWLAQEKGAYPLFDCDAVLNGVTHASKLSEETQTLIRQYGLRNSHLTSIAPTGTISLLAGNVSSGIEPVFALSYDRKILQGDGSRITEAVEDYAVARYRDLHPGAMRPDYFVTAQTLAPEAHVRMQAAAQKWVDSSISKTVNCPEDISFEDFQAIYELAYELGCKGCTTYRPNDVTGSVLSVTEAPKAEAVAAVELAAEPEPTARPEVLEGATCKIKWPGSEHAIYVTISDIMENGRRRPFEIFINSKNMEHFAWTVALTRMISAVFRRPHDSRFVAEELKAVFDPKGGAWVSGKYVPSVLASIGAVIEQHMKAIGYIESTAVRHESAPLPISVGPVKTFAGQKTAQFCPKCSSSNVKNESGCFQCIDCGESKCG